MPEWSEEEEAAAREQWKQLMAGIQAAYERRASDPYSLGVEVRAALDDRDLYLKLQYDSARQMLTEIPGVDLPILFHGAAVVQVCSRAESDKYGWPKMELFATLLEGGVVERPPGDLGDVTVKVHVGTKRVSKRFADCSLEELKALADDIEKSRPKKKPDPLRPHEPPPPPAATDAGLTTAGKTLAVGLALAIAAWAAKWAWQPVQWGSLAGGTIVVAVIMKLGWAASWQLTKGLFAWAKGPGRWISGGFLAAVAVVVIIGILQPPHPRDRGGPEVAHESPWQSAPAGKSSQIDTPSRDMPRQEIGAPTSPGAAPAFAAPAPQPPPSEPSSPGARQEGSTQLAQPQPVGPAKSSASGPSAKRSRETNAVEAPATAAESRPAPTVYQIPEHKELPKGPHVRDGQLLQVGGQDDAKDLTPEQLKAKQHKDGSKPAKCCQD